MRDSWKIRQIMDIMCGVPLNGVYNGKAKQVNIRMPVELLDALKKKDVNVSAFLIDAATKTYLWRYWVLPKEQPKRERWNGSVEEMPA